MGQGVLLGQGVRQHCTADCLLCTAPAKAQQRLTTARYYKNLQGKETGQSIYFKNRDSEGGSDKVFDSG